ncbi:hypothetical protein ACQY0O_006686 [Thecaphora frezii]
MTNNRANSDSDDDDGRHPPSPPPKRARTLHHSPTSSPRPTPTTPPDEALARLIIALDLDAFYVSAARKRDPSLVGLPLGIQQKGLLATISYEARAMGVQKLASVRDAVRKCPDLVLLNGEDLSYFRQLSNQVYTLVHSIVWKGRVEKLGMDELFCDVTEMVDAHLAALEIEGGQLDRDEVQQHRFHLQRQGSSCSPGFFDYQDWPALPRGHVLPARSAERLLDRAPDHYQRRLLVAAHLAAYLRQQVSDQIGLTCSAGIAHSKTLAKLAGAKHKPNQQTTFVPHAYGPDLARARLGQVQDWLDPLPLAQINGFGRVAVDKIQKTLLVSLRADSHAPRTKLTVGVTRKVASLPLMTELFGAKVGERLWSLVCGIDREPVVPAPEFPLQISVEDTYPGIGIRGQGIHDQILVLSHALLRRLETELIKENREASLEGICHETVSSNQELAPDPPSSALATHVELRSYRQIEDAAEDPDRDPGSALSSKATAAAQVSSRAGRQKTWLRYPLKVRLSVRQGWNSRITKQAPMPVQVFDLSLSRTERTNALYKACRPLLRALIGGDDVVGEPMNLINIAALDLVDKRPTKALESFFGATKPASAPAPAPAAEADAGRESHSVRLTESKGVDRRAARGQIDLDFVATLPEDIRTEVMREYGLSTETGAVGIGVGVAVSRGTAPHSTATGDTAQDGYGGASDADIMTVCQEDRNRGGSPAEQQGCNEADRLVCPRCRQGMVVWMQHDHEAWPATGLPPQYEDEALVCQEAADEDANSDCDCDEEPDRRCRQLQGSLDGSVWGGRELEMASEGSRRPDGGGAKAEAGAGTGPATGAGEEATCPQCLAAVPGWMWLAHERFHQLTGCEKEAE